MTIDVPGRAGRRGADRDERGFTLVELMVVVLIVAILVAIAIPVYAGARKRANDRALHTYLRHALAAEKIFYTGYLRYADDTAGEMTGIESGLPWSNGMTPTLVRRVYLAVDGTDIVYISGRSVSGICYYLVDDALIGTGYAEDPACGPADAQSYTTGGW